jgi:hypothetical protein
MHHSCSTGSLSSAQAVPRRYDGRPLNRLAANPRSLTKDVSSYEKNTYFAAISALVFSRIPGPIVVERDSVRM